MRWYIKFFRSWHCSHPADFQVSIAAMIRPSDHMSNVGPITPRVTNSEDNKWGLPRKWNFQWSSHSFSKSICMKSPKLTFLSWSRLTLFVIQGIPISCLVWDHSEPCQTNARKWDLGGSYRYSVAHLTRTRWVHSKLCLMGNHKQPIPEEDSRTCYRSRCWVSF